MRQILALFLLLPSILLTAQHSKINHLAGQSCSTICYMGKPQPGLVILPPTNSRNNAKEPATFEVTYGATVPEAAKTAFNRATTILSNLLSSPIPISVNVQFEDDLEAGTLAGAFPGTYRQNFQNAPLRNTWYPIALAEKIAQREFNNNSTPFDIGVTVNSQIQWNYTSQNISAGEFDFVTVLLHEIIHGLGFAGFSNYSNAEGTGTLLLEGFPIAYNRYIENGNEENLLATFPDRSVAMGTQLTSNDLFLATPTFTTDGNLPKIFAPTNYSRGSSIGHLDERTYNNTNNALMTPSISPGAIIHDPGIALDILYDLGWSFTNIVHEPGTGEQDFNKPYIVSAQVLSDNGFDASSLILHYSRDTFKTEQTIQMVATPTPNEFSATIPAPGERTQYQYYISVVDNRGITFLSPSQAPNPLFYEFFYAVDETNPVIAHEPVSTIDDQAIALRIDASVTDFFTGLNTVAIEYKINGLPFPLVPMEKDFTDGFRPDLYIGAIPLPTGGLNEADLLEYRIIATDKSPARNMAISPNDTDFYSVRVTQTLNAVSTYVNDFEVEEGDFNGIGFSIQSASGFSNQAIHSDHPYANAGANNTRNSFYTLRFPIIIRKKEAFIEFDEIVLVEPSTPGTDYTQTGFWDYVIVEGRRIDSDTWLPFLPGYDSRTHANWLSTYNSRRSGNNSIAPGRPNLYQNRTIDMQENGNFAAGDTVLVRFRLFSDPFAVGWGWAIDELRIQDSTVGIEDFVEKQDFVLYPNPVSNQLLQVAATFKQEVKEVELQISDIYGRLVYRQKYAAFGKVFQQAIDMSALSKGIYLVTMRLDEKESVSRRLVRQ